LMIEFAKNLLVAVRAVTVAIYSPSSPFSRIRQLERVTF
jgi:hypothetical protein